MVVPSPGLRSVYAVLRCFAYNSMQTFSVIITKSYSSLALRLVLYAAFATSIAGMGRSVRSPEWFRRLVVRS
jgi:hypothetical protein